MESKTDGIVFKGRNKSPPPGALRISKNEATRMQWNLVQQWSPVSEIWSLRFGHIFISSVTAVTSMLITNHYRRRLRLGSYGRFSIHVPTVLVPCFFSGLFHFKFVMQPILLQQECPVCIQLRGSAIQLLFSVVVPAMLAPVSTFWYAYRFGSYQLPPFSWKNKNEFINIYWKITKRYNRSFGGLIAVNALLVTYFTYLQGTQFFKMQLKTIEERLAAQNAINNNLTENDKLK